MAAANSRPRAASSSSSSKVITCRRPGRSCRRRRSSLSAQRPRRGRRRLRVAEHVGAVTGRRVGVDRRRDRAYEGEREVEAAPTRHASRRGSRTHRPSSPRAPAARWRDRRRVGRLGPRHLLPAVCPLGEVEGRGALRSDGVAPEPADRASRRGSGTDGEPTLHGNRPRNEKEARRARELDFSPSLDGMRTTWNGAISFGLVTIPIGLAPATKPARPSVGRLVPPPPPRVQDADQAEAVVPVPRTRVGPDEIVNGWEVAKGEFVIVEDADLEAIEHDSTSRAIDITGFVPEDAVDPIYFDRTYFLVPRRRAARDVRTCCSSSRDAGDADGCARPLRPRRQGEALPDPRPWRRAGARDVYSSPRTSTRRRRSRRRSPRRT